MEIVKDMTCGYEKEKKDTIKCKRNLIITSDILFFNSSS